TAARPRGGGAGPGRAVVGRCRAVWPGLVPDGRARGEGERVPARRRVVRARTGGEGRVRGLAGGGRGRGGAPGHRVQPVLVRLVAGRLPVPPRLVRGVERRLLLLHAGLPGRVLGRERLGGRLGVLGRDLAVDGVALAVDLLAAVVGDLVGARHVARRGPVQVDEVPDQLRLLGVQLLPVRGDL